MTPRLFCFCTIAVILVAAFHVNLSLTALTVGGKECGECGMWIGSGILPWMVIVANEGKFHYATLIGPKVAIGNSEGLEHSTAAHLKAYVGLANVLDITEKMEHMSVEKIIAKREAEGDKHNVLLLLILKPAENSQHKAVTPLCLSNKELGIAPQPVAMFEHVDKDNHRQTEVFKALPFFTKAIHNEHEAIRITMKTSYQLVKGAAVIHHGFRQYFSLAGVENEDNHSHEMPPEPHFLNADSEDARNWIVEKADKNIICQMRETEEALSDEDDYANHGTDEEFGKDSDEGKLKPK